jgi:nucleoside-diphosphate-sugar epimerase
MTSNRIAVYGHRGWASSKIVESLAASDAYLRVLYRPGSDVSTIPANVEKVELVLTDQEALMASLKDIDIMM